MSKTHHPRPNSIGGGGGCVGPPICRRGEQSAALARQALSYSLQLTPPLAKPRSPARLGVPFCRAEQSSRGARTHAWPLFPPCREHTRTYVCVDESELLRERGCVGGMVGKVTHPGRASASLRIVQHARRVWAHFQLCRKGSIRPPICNNVRVCTYLCACVCACVHIQTALCPTSSPLSPPRPAGLAWVTTFIWPRSRPCLTPNLSRTDGQTDTYIHTCSSSSIIPPAAAPPFFSRFDPLHLASVLHTARFGHFHRALSHLVRL